MQQTVCVKKLSVLYSPLVLTFNIPVHFLQICVHVACPCFTCSCWAEVSCCWAVEWLSLLSV